MSEPLPEDTVLCDLCHQPYKSRGMTLHRRKCEEKQEQRAHAERHKRQMEERIGRELQQELRQPLQPQQSPKQHGVRLLAVQTSLRAAWSHEVNRTTLCSVDDDDDEQRGKRQKTKVV
ncbi:hypothetical protein BDN72DRAFT_907369 [Pluteus cervinus]|uniref:Uncharacterized protein n=1 Tax=Pluteus cervinus TaxID=181527 RepID=A0ACD2ZWW8_9AGAR|nr:hypothetical protein BDN72DRAFT_907369 [Pluteus cervinus]